MLTLSFGDHKPSVAWSLVSTRYHVRRFITRKKKKRETRKVHLLIKSRFVFVLENIICSILGTLGVQHKSFHSQPIKKVYILLANGIARITIQMISANRNYFSEMIGLFEIKHKPGQVRGFALQQQMWKKVLGAHTHTHTQTQGISPYLQTCKHVYSTVSL